PIRRQWLTAMTLVAGRFGTESLQWEECLRVTGTIVESARRRQRASTDTMLWIEQVLRSLGYEEAEAKALALQLTNLGVDEYRSGPVERMALARAPLEVQSDHREPEQVARGLEAAPELERPTLGQSSVVAGKGQVDPREKR